jgi:hypothetical protein
VKLSKQPGWVPVGSGPDDRWHREAFEGTESDGTYELCGPKVQGNPEGFNTHVLVRHDLADVLWVPRDFDGLRDWLLDHRYEGIVWHWPQPEDSVTMAKIKRRDFA